MQGKQDVIVRPVHLEQPNLHKLAEAVIRLVLEDAGQARVVRRTKETPTTLRRP